MRTKSQTPDPTRPVYPPEGGSWLTFTTDHDEQAAVATFKQRYGYAPAKVVLGRYALWLGPVGRQEKP